MIKECVQSQILCFGNGFLGRCHGYFIISDCYFCCCPSFIWCVSFTAQMLSPPPLGPLRLRTVQSAGGPSASVAAAERVLSSAALPKNGIVFPLFDPCRHAYAPIGVEFITSLAFTLFSDLLSVLLFPTSSDHSPPQLQDIALFEGALSLALICAFRPFGSAHFNPAVTFASLLTLNLPVLLGLGLLFAQFFGSFFGALLFHSSISSSTFIDASLQLGTIRTVVENMAHFEQQNVPTFPTLSIDQMTETDTNGRISPFSNRLQMFILECLCSLLIVLAYLFCDLSSAYPSAECRPHPSLLPQAFSVASTRVVASAVGARSPLGQSANLARATANAILTTIFTRPGEFIIWRFFYIHFFGAFCSAIVGAAIFWIVKSALVENSTQPQQNNGQT